MSQSVFRPRPAIDLEECIRSGSHPDDPRIVYVYLSLCAEARGQERWRRYQRACDLLFNAVCNEQALTHWRQTCLDNIFQPLGELQRMARTQAEQHYVRTRVVDLQRCGQRLLDQRN